MRLATDELELLLAPDAGGSIAALRWRGLDLLRPGDAAAGPLAMGCFPLVPFSNRIGDGSFTAPGRMVQLPPNFVQAGRAETIHGFGWQAAWDVVQCGAQHARLEHRYCGSAWPWPYLAEQQFALAGPSLLLRLSLTNLGDTPMPAGLGLHPYFPRRRARLELAVDGRWDNDDAGLPACWAAIDTPPDWLGGDAIDHSFTGRKGPIRVHWPDRRLRIDADPGLGFTVVYAPPRADFFCVEPVSHLTNAVNRSADGAATGLTWLAPGESWSLAAKFTGEAADKIHAGDVGDLPR